jgi:hypothetical protein
MTQEAVMPTIVATGLVAAIAVGGSLYVTPPWDIYAMVLAAISGTAAVFLSAVRMRRLQ